MRAIPKAVTAMAFVATDTVTRVAVSTRGERLRCGTRRTYPLFLPEGGGLGGLGWLFGGGGAFGGCLPRFSMTL